MPDVKDVKWGEDNSIDNAPKLTEEEVDALEKRKQAFDKLLVDQQKAKYKIEVMFAHTRRVHGLSSGMLSIWESGSKFHGGGDTKIYWCPAQELKISDCDGIIPDASNGYGHLVCPKCQKVWQGDKVYGEIFYKLEARAWAKVLLKHYIRLGHNADIYLKYPRYDLRVASDLEQAKQQMGEKLAQVRKERLQYLYPLAHIIRDTSNGSDLEDRFHAFLTA